MPSSVSLEMSQIYIYKVKSAALQKFPMRNIHNNYFLNFYLNEIPNRYYTNNQANYYKNKSKSI